MPAEVDGNVIEILSVPEPRAHILGRGVEILWGTPGTVPTQEAATHARVLEVLAIPEARAHTLGQVSELLWLDLTFQQEREALSVELLWGTPGVIPTQEAALHAQVVEVLSSPSTLGEVLGTGVELLVSYNAAVAAVSDISGPSATPATFDGTTSLGFITQYRWNWVSVPGGSFLANSAQPFPDFGGTSPIDMTGNVLLYHAEETVGTTGADTSGTGNTANLTAITVGAVGQVGLRSWEFTGSTSRAQPIAPVALPGDYTIAYWFYNLAPNSAWRTGTRGNATDHQIMVEIGSDRLGVHMGGFIPVSPQFDMPSASFVGWHHIVAVGVGGVTEFTVDGVFIGSAAGQSVDSINSIGNYQGGGQRFADRLDEISIWNRAMSRQEASRIYWLQYGNYAGVGPGFTFTPDVDGIYTINLTVVDGADGNLTVDTAIATIGGASGGGVLFPLQGDAIRMWAHLQGQPLRRRDEN